MSNTKANFEEYDWGSKRTDYYSKNKKNKDDDDFLEEEEEAKKIQMEKLKKLQEAKLLDSDEESFKETKKIKKISLYSSDEEDNNKTGNGNLSLLKNNNINNNDKSRKTKKSLLLNSSSKLPEKSFSQDELTEFTQILKNIKINSDELNENVLPIEQVLESEDLKLEKTLNYFQMKKHTHSLYITYLTFYLYFKSIGKINDHHPVIKKMYFLKSIINSDKENKEKIFEKIDKTLELINEKKDLEEQNENIEEELEKDENQDLDLNESNEDNIDSGEEEYEEDDFDLDEEDDNNEELNAEDILDLNDDFEEEKLDSKKTKNNLNKKNNQENLLLKNKRIKPDSILDIDFNINEKNNKSKKNQNIDLIENKNNKDIDKFVQENIEKLQALKEKKEKLAENIKIKNDKEHTDKIEMGIRLANKNLLKSRGIYRKRKQYQGNAKVHNREKYLKKQKLRKNMVKEYDGKPDVYIGETTGIRRDLIRSTKIQ